MKPPTYFDLGASLYLPCSHHNLARILAAGTSGARSMVFCLEDAVREDQVALALRRLASALSRLEPRDGRLLRFVRPRSPDMLADLLRWPQIDKLDGFVLPKADRASLPCYRRALAEAGRRFALMPTLETPDVLDYTALPALREEIQALGDGVIAVRIGGNDLLGLIGLRRMPGVSIYDTPVRACLDQLILAFRPYGYELCAPVFDCIEDPRTLLREVLQDLSYGFFAKTAIHPTQVAPIEGAYSAFAAANLAHARATLDHKVAAVSRLDGRMVEPACHGNWARRTLKLAAALGQGDA